MFSCEIHQRGAFQKTTSLDAVHDALADPGSLVWVDVDAPEPEFIEALQEAFNLHDLAIEDVLEAHQRPKLDAYAQALFMVLPVLEYHEPRLVSDELHLFIGERFIITITHGVPLGREAVRRRMADQPDPTSIAPMFVAHAILDVVADRFGEMRRILQEAFQSLETALLEEESARVNLQRSYRLMRQLRTLGDNATAVGEIVDDLLRRHAQRVPDDLRPYIKDVQDHAMRAGGRAERMREMLVAAMEINLALVSIHQNETVQTLSGWAAVLAVPTVVFGLYGMNFTYMPELQLHNGYFFILGGTLLVCVLLYLHLRRIGWM